MSISTEQIQVLQMIEEGKINVEEGTSLLKALESPSTRRASHFATDPNSQRMLRVQVDDTRSTRRKVNIILPMALVNVGLKIAGHCLDEESSQHAAEIYQAIYSGETGKIIEIHDNQDGEHVRIYLE